ncbi:MAG TPA: SH3 domain-containing protein [Gammaproteobacteria bacterium]|nr:SH3 domain-containing protein [Gammaproteobacteria bacterium]
MKKFMIVLLGLISFSAFATSLSLYQNPDSKSNVIASVKEGQAIIPIFNQGDWVKIGDPTNGNVGWVSKEALQKSGYPQMSMQISGSKNPEEVKKMMDNIQKQQAEFQSAISKYMQQNIQNMTKLNQDFGQLWTMSPDDQAGKK